MPRVTIWNGEYNDSTDYCKAHQPSVMAADSDVTVNDEHPDYEGEDYRCETCNKVLTARDN
jgi:hypothetical protein